MTGSAMECNEMEMDVVLGLLLGEKGKKGGSLREGGSKILPDGRLTDLFFLIFRHFWSTCFCVALWRPLCTTLGAPWGAV